MRYFNWSKRRGKYRGTSKRDFIAKLQIAYKEARETTYWLRLLIVTTPAAAPKAVELKDKSEELLRIIAATLKSSKE